MTYKERIAATVPNPDANEKTIFNDAADGLLKTKDSSGVVETLATTEGIADTEPKVYVALLSQTGTDAPVATVLKNTLGGEVVWDYFGVGSYSGTLVGAFTENKTVSPSSNKIIEGDVDTYLVQASIYRSTNDYITFQCYDMVADDGINGVLNSFLVEVLVYP